jgi:hypothetical protein
LPHCACVPNAPGAQAEEVSDTTGDFAGVVRHKDQGGAAVGDRMIHGIEEHPALVDVEPLARFVENQ